VPVQGLNVGQLGLFGNGLLQATLTETHLAGGRGGPDLIHRLPLAHGQQTATSGQGGPQALQSLLQVRM
jgi:hypothetical protein